MARLLSLSCLAFCSSVMSLLWTHRNFVVSTEAQSSVSLPQRLHRDTRSHFAAASTPQISVALPRRLRIGTSSQSEPFTTSIHLANLLAAAATAVVCARAARSVVARNAKKKQKKGVRVIDGREVPWNLFPPKKPCLGRIVANETLTQPTGDPNWETCHITIDHGGQLPYVEGQCIGVVAPGPDKKGETPAKLRLYSIASSGVGDDETSGTVSLCVKRNVLVDAEHANREVGVDEEYPENRVYRGVCSDHLCDSSVGDEVVLTGPVGAELLLPEDPDATLLMICTGTGIAPMRSYLRHLFHDADGVASDGSRKFKGSAWLLLGVPYSNSVLYHEEHEDYKLRFPDQFRYDYAVSREQENAAGQKMYIQTKMAEYGDELWELMQKENTHVYLCGLKGMEHGMSECFGPIAEKAGSSWDEFYKGLKKAGRYHIEVY